MTIDAIRREGRKTWGDTPMSLAHIAITLEVVAGDICREARNSIEKGSPQTEELKKELGNLITSGIRWCDDLGYDPQECIRLSQEAHTRYVAAHMPDNL